MDNSSNLGRRKNRDQKLETENCETRDQHRVVITKDANEAIDLLVASVNEEFEAGEITKSDIANYVFLNLPRFILESDIKILRAQHFNPKKALTSLLKGKNGIPEELQKTLRAMCGIGDTPKKKLAKPSPELSTVPIVDKLIAS